MKKQLLFVVSLITIFMASCSQNDDILNEVIDNDALAKIEMSYEQQLKGYTPEEVAAPKDESTPSTEPETVADAELMNLIQESVESSYSKTRVTTPRVGGAYPFYGVFKHTTCGIYPELKIYMDCEDGGWTNVNEQLKDSRLQGTWVDGNRNIIMSFCVVMNDRTEFIPYGFGALYFSGGNAHHITQNGKYISSAISGNSVLEFIERFHDNEDSNPQNKFEIIDNAPIGQHSWDINDYQPDYTPTPTHVSTSNGNSLLTWVFNKGVPIKQFNPGFSYGLLCYNNKINNPEIHISIDDENKKNTNAAKLVQWHNTGYRRNPDYTEQKYGDLIFGGNTDYFVKVFK